MEPLVEQEFATFEISSGDIIKELFPCKKCGKCFDKKTKLYNHNKIHSSRKYTCNICLRVFSMKSYLDVHQRTHGPNKKPYKCYVCQKGYAFKDYLARHIKIHRNATYKCDLCPKTFATTNYLAHHKKIHASEKSFVCPICSKAFLLKEYLIRHSKIHNNVKIENRDSQGPEEEEMRTAEQSIKTSTASDDQNQPSDNKFSCTLCSKSFSLKRVLTRHMKSHVPLNETDPNEMTENLDASILEDGSQPNKKSCPICSKVFLHKKNLKRHIFNVHPLSKDNINSQETNEVEVQEITNISQDDEKFYNWSSNEELHQCPLCAKAFSNKSNLKKHLRKIHLINENKLDSYDEPTNKAISKIFQTKRDKNTVLECKKCLKTFASFSKLSYHHQLQRCPRGFQCPFCEQCFKRDYSLKFHLKEHNVEKINPVTNEDDQSEDILTALNINEDDYKSETFECQVCFEKFGSKRALSCHEDYHKSDKIYECDLCSKSFVSPKSLFTHKKAHLTRTNYECQVCHEVFTGKTILNNHMKVHTYEKTYSCEICEFVYCSENALKNHYVHHEELRMKQPQNYICEACGMTFEEPSLLATHLENNEHVGIPCEICERYLSNEFSLMRHMKIHEGNKPLPNRIGRFKSAPRTIPNKLLRIGESEFYCKQCSLAFESSDLLLKHKNEHACFTCEICNKTFSRKVCLKRHLNTHSGVKPYKCNVCLKSFSQKGNLLNHVTLHEDVKPFVCLICSLSFKTKSYLLTHEKQHSSAYFLKCDSCNKIYSDISGLRKHKKTTNCGKLIECEENDSLEN